MNVSSIRKSLYASSDNSHKSCFSARENKSRSSRFAEYVATRVMRTINDDSPRAWRQIRLVIGDALIVRNATGTPPQSFNFALGSSPMPAPKNNFVAGFKIAMRVICIAIFEPAVIMISV